MRRSVLWSANIAESERSRIGHDADDDEGSAMNDEEPNRDEDIDGEDENDDTESPGRGNCKTVPKFSLRLLLTLSLLHAA